MADLNLQKIDLSSIKAIAHDGVSLQVLVERAGRFANQYPSVKPISWLNGERRHS